MKFENTKGFTLVEILVVITIVGILSMLAVNGYATYRKSALLDLAADDLIAQIAELKSKVVHGNFGEGAPAKCLGVEFKDDVNGTLISLIEAKYSNKKKWDSDVGRWEVGGCDTPTPGGSLVVDEMVKIEAFGDDYQLLFLPPQGRVETDLPEDFEFVIQYGESNEDRYKKVIMIDPVSGQASKKNYESTI